MIRTKLQSKLRKKGYDYETTTLHPNPWFPRSRTPKLILIGKSHTAHEGTAFTSRKCWNKYLLPDEVVRPVGMTYIYMGRKPTARRRRK